MLLVRESVLIGTLQGERGGLTRECCLPLKVGARGLLLTGERALQRGTG